MDVGNATSSAGAADGKLEKEPEEKADNVDANIETDKMEVDKTYTCIGICFLYCHNESV